VALYLLHRLYSIKTLEESSLEDLKKLIADDFLLRELLEIDPKLKPEDLIHLKIEESNWWHNTSKFFKSSVRDIQRLLEIVPEAPPKEIMAI
jgi:hypothetical protein